jgi:hypothetical protein
MIGADLTETWLGGANLTRAILKGTDLTRTVLARADLTDVWLGGMDLTSADGLTVDQVVAAQPSPTTRLPAAIAADPSMVARIAEVAAERAPRSR